MKTDVLSLPQTIGVAQRLGVALSTGGFFELGAPEALQERIGSLDFAVHSVRRPVAQHEQEVREPRRSAGGKEGTR